MAHRLKIRNEAKRLFEEELMSISEIAQQTEVPPCTLYRWRKKDKWDNKRNLSAADKWELSKVGKYVIIISDDNIVIIIKE